MKKVVWADLSAYGPPGEAEQATLSAVAQVHYHYDKPDAEAFIERCRGAYAIISDSVKVTREIIDHLKGLEMISVLGTGTNQIDASYARSVGITLCNTPHYGDSTVAEYALGLMLAISRHIVKADRSMRKGGWPKLTGLDLRGATMGIVGLGGIGSELAAMGNALGMTVLCHTRHPTGERAQRHKVRFVDLDELMSRADFVQLAAELNDDTRAIVGRSQMERMKPTAYLINAARGGLVDEMALLDMLKSERIAGYATDVYELEPAIDHPLAKLDNVVVTPHNAWNTPGSGMRQIQIAAANVLAYLEGKPQNIVE